MDRRRMLFGLLWCVALYVTACIIAGIVSGVIAGSRDAANAFETGTRAGLSGTVAWQGYFLIVAVLISSICTWKGALPGTELKSNKSDVRTHRFRSL